MVKVRRSGKKANKSTFITNSFTKRSPNYNSTNNKKKKVILTMPWSVLVWSLVLFHVMNCCDWALAGERNENSISSDQSEEMDFKYGSSNDNGYVDEVPLYEWSPYRSPPGHPLCQGSNEGSKWHHSPAAFPLLAKEKRAVYGILGLATKRPHKTASEIQHLPPTDAFMSVRGKKKRSVTASLPLYSSSLSPLNVFRRTVSVSPPRVYLHPGKLRKLTNGENLAFFRAGKFKSAPL